MTFEEQYAAYRRSKRWYAVLMVCGFAFCVIASVVTAKFNLLTLLQGLPRTTEFLVKLVPPPFSSSVASVRPSAP